MASKDSVPDQRKQGTMNKSVKRDKNEMQIPPLAKPLRILQLIALSALFGSIVYRTTLISLSEMSTPTMTIIFSILFLVLTTVFVFVLTVDIISQFDDSRLTDTPMISFSFVGFILFAMTSIMMLFYMISIDSHWVIQMMFFLCVISTILFLVDLILYFTFWKEKYLKRNNKLYPDIIEKYKNPDTDILYLSRDSSHKKQPKECNCDLSTSISNVNQSIAIEDSNKDHIYRKIGVGRRREYADFSENTPSLLAVDAVQVQTEPRKILVAESQTNKSELKEVPVQTIHQPEQNYFRIDQPSCIFPTTNSICPAVLQLIRGGMTTQCFSICKCGQETVIHEQQHQHLQLQLLQSEDNEATSSRSILGQNRGTNQATCFCPTFEIDLPSQSINSSKPVTNLTVSYYTVKNNKRTQTFSNEMSEKELEMNQENKMNNSKRDKKNEEITINDIKYKKDSHDEQNAILDKEIISDKTENVEMNSISNEVLQILNKEIISDKTENVEMNSISNEVLKILNKTDSRVGNTFTLSEKIIQMSQDAINKAEETLSTSGSYDKSSKLLKNPKLSTTDCSELCSSIRKSGLFHKRNKIEPFDLTKSNNSTDPFDRQPVLKLRLPLENCASETRIINANQQQNDKQIFQVKERCTCIPQSKKTHEVCTIQVQYIFQNSKGRTICKSCATPESIRIPQKITCSAHKFLKCYECSKVLSPPCKCSACSKKYNPV